MAVINIIKSKCLIRSCFPKSGDKVNDHRRFSQILYVFLLCCGAHTFHHYAAVLIHFTTMLRCSYISPLCCGAHTFHHYAAVLIHFTTMLRCSYISPLCCGAHTFHHYAAVLIHFTTMLRCSYISPLCCGAHTFHLRITINRTFEGESFCGFHRFSINHERFPYTYFNTQKLFLFLF